jgi:hypothetical protein
MPPGPWPRSSLVFDILRGMDAANDVQRVRVSDAEREAVVARLSAATGEGRLTLEEFGDRAGRAYTARTQGDLVELVDDLPAGRAAVVAGGGVPRPVSHLSPLGSIKRSGRWRLDRDTEMVAVVGSVKLDLRQAEIAAPEVELHVRAVVGSVKVWIPRGVRVEVDGVSVLGSRQIAEDSGSGYPGAPLLRLRVDTVVGSVKVYRR